MQRTFLIGSLLFSCCFLAVSFGQNRGNFGGVPGRPPVLAPIGSVGRAPIVSPFGRPLPNPTGNGSVYGSTYRNGRHGNYGYGYGIGAYPVYIGGFSGDYYQGYTDPSLAGPQSQIPPPAPPVVINQYFTQAPPPQGPAVEDSDMQVYQQPTRQSQADAPAAPEPRTYLIAFRDHSVYSALAYWVEDHTLHYVTTQNTHNQADLNLIDVDFTRKLNQDRNLPFSLNPAQH